MHLLKYTYSLQTLACEQIPLLFIGVFQHCGQDSFALLHVTEATSYEVNHIAGVRVESATLLLLDFHMQLFLLAQLPGQQFFLQEGVSLEVLFNMLLIVPNIEALADAHLALLLIHDHKVFWPAVAF